MAGMVLSAVILIEPYRRQGMEPLPDHHHERLWHGSKQMDVNERLLGHETGKLASHSMGDRRRDRIVHHPAVACGIYRRMPARERRCSGSLHIPTDGVVHRIAERAQLDLQRGGARRST